MNIFDYLESVGVRVMNPLVLYNLQRLDTNAVKITSLMKARQRAESTENKNTLDLTIAIFQRYQRAIS
ncbi:hypothetical protein [Pseudoalteromonas sp. SCQQ13]|uniref:hypothetical protein n=1 Tax=Pseudoalteromonas sp. SCQQ13 TaxID=2792066 RepID=UPI0018CFE855|nr:hypothetical protein [Pseudoalteromonas sp. SCQQ13]MBH0093342.1 hypothetical protein [Pseudoalteromonas sp. SCQQ13]